MPIAAAKAAFRARSTETQRASMYKIKDKHLSSATASAAAKLRRGTSLAAKVGKEAAGRLAQTTRGARPDDDATLHGVRRPSLDEPRRVLRSSPRTALATYG